MPHWRRGAHEQELTGVKRRSAAGGVVEAEILARSACKLGKRSARVRGVNPPKESKNGSVARRLAGSEEMVKGGYFALAWLLIARGEREGAVPVPHIGDSRPTAHRSGQNEARAGAPVFDR
jgi:hypothetical protein